MTTSNIYNWHLEQGLLSELSSKITALEPSSVVLLCDSKVYKLYRKELDDLGLSLTNCSLYLIKSSEQAKSLASVQKIYTHLLKHHANRSSLIVAIGGGIVGDIATFVASSYYRGLKLMLVPTTLISMVDSCLGGKGGVNFKGYKNLIGSFYVANSVMIDPNFLQSLSLKNLKDGLAEVVKYAFLFDEELFTELEQLELSNFVEHCKAIIERCLELKASVVQNDTYDQGERQKLNFGHTFGHALEKASHGKISHGQAVAMAMVSEHKLSMELDLSDEATHNRLIKLLQKLQIYQTINKKYAKALTHHILHDKKSSSTSTITLPYVEKIACCKLQSFDFKVILNFINNNYK